jgi:hypothetical protein
MSNRALARGGSLIMALNPGKLRTRTGGCGWCVHVCTKLTEDHVPPRSVFPKRVWSSLPIMPACPDCNSKWKNEAEYFRDYLLIDALAECKHPELLEIRGNYERACQRRLSKGKKRSIFQTDLALTIKALADRVPVPEYIKV